MTSSPLPRLMDHQNEGVDFLTAGQAGLLAFEQGLGKTLVAIEAFRRLRENGSVRALVVICPNSLKSNWVQEVRRFAPELEVHIVAGSAHDRRRDLWANRAPVVVVSYETARNEIATLRALLGRVPSVLVLDESHYVKNCRSLNSIASHHLAPLTAYRWLLTGTPVTNSPADLYSQISLVANDRPLGSLASFTARYGTAVDSPLLRDELARTIKPYLLRRTKEDCLDLPGKSFTDIHVDLPAWQRRLYDTVRDQLLSEIQGMGSQQFKRFAATALVRLLRLSQIASNPRLVFPDEGRCPGKFGELDALVEELASESRRKLIIWSHYVQSIESLLERYSGFNPVAIYGKVPVETRQDLVERFQTDPSTRIFIGNPSAAGTGLTLTAATYTIYESLSWRYDHYAQSQDRNHRIGQTTPVVYLRLIASDTVEEAIAETLGRKEVLARSIVGDGPARRIISEMGREGFCELLRTGRFPSEAMAVLPSATPNNREAPK